MAFKERKHLKVSHFGLKTFIASKYWREKQQQKKVNFSALLWWTFHSAALTPRVVNGAASTVLTSVKCVCSRATQQESYGQRSACLALLTQSAHYAAQQRSSSHIMLHIFNIVTELASRALFFPPPLAPISFYGLLSSFFVFPLMEAAVLPCLHPEVRRIKLHLHFFSPLLRGCKFMIALLRELRPRRRSRNSEAQSRLSEVVGGWFRTACPRLCPLVFLAWL